MTDYRTLKELAQEVLAITNSSNIVEITWLFSQAMLELRAINHLSIDEGKEHLHPIAVLYSYKISALTNSTVHNALSDAYLKVTKIANE